MDGGGVLGGHAFSLAGAEPARGGAPDSLSALGVAVAPTGGVPRVRRTPTSRLLCRGLASASRVRRTPTARLQCVGAEFGAALGRHLLVFRVMRRSKLEVAGQHHMRWRLARGPPFSAGVLGAMDFRFRFRLGLEGGAAKACMLAFAIDSYPIVILGLLFVYRPRAGRGVEPSCGRRRS